MGFLDNILTDSLGSAGQQPDSSMPTGHSAAGMILSLIGGTTGLAPLWNLGQMFNNQAAAEYDQATWGKRAKVYQDQGLINQETADWLGGMSPQHRQPLEAELAKRMVSPAAKQSLQAVFNQKTGRESFVLPTPGMELPEGEVTPTFFKKPGEAKIPTGEQALAMQMLGTSDISQLASHPEAVAAAHEQLFNQQKQQAADIARQGREDYFRFAQSFKPSLQDKVKEETAKTQARLAATNAALQQQPFNRVDKQNIPFVTMPNGQEVPIPTTLPYGQIAGNAHVFYVPKTAVTNGTYMRLNALPKIGEQLVNAAPGAVGSGSVGGAIKQEILGLRGSPKVSAYQTAGATYVDTVASALSRRVSDPLIRRWQKSIYGNFATPDSVKTAVGEINQAAADMKQTLRTTAASDVGSGASDLLKALSGGADSTDSGTGESEIPPPPPLISTPPPPPGFD